MSKIVEALKKLDANNDAHWTSDGMPRLDTVRLMAADQTVTREDIAKVAPGFTRTSTELPGAPAEAQAPVVKEEVQAATQALTQVGEGATEAGEVGEADPDDRADTSLQEQHDELVQTLADMDAALARFNVERAKVVKELDGVILALEAATPKSSTNAIQGYLASQNASARKKAAQVQAIRDQGISPEVLLKIMGTRAPVDAARQRKNKIDGA